MPSQVTIYTTNLFPYCERAKTLLKKKKADFKEVDITSDDKTRQEVEAKTGWMTVPMIFIGDEFIGGCDELYGLEANGKLDQKLANPK